MRIFRKLCCWSRITNTGIYWTKIVHSGLCYNSNKWLSLAERRFLWAEISDVKEENDLGFIKKCLNDYKNQNEHEWKQYSLINIHGSLFPYNTWRPLMQSICVFALIFFLLKCKHYLQSENGIANVSDQVKFIWSLSVFVPLSHTAHWVHKATSRRLFEVVLSIKTRISWENQSDPIFTEEALRNLCSVMLLKTSRN